ncbi:hypothetical protein HYU23_02900 [Candidatus Woesearchaeota archaeon]|nr:hypothetical protein [Candidatus Woesearchaeota archaeon]
MSNKTLYKELFEDIEEMKLTGISPIKINQDNVRLKYIEEAAYEFSPYRIRAQDIKDLNNLKPGMRIRVVDDLLIRAQYVALGESYKIYKRTEEPHGFYPGKECIIKEIYKGESSVIIKIEGDPNYWADEWFERPKRR